MSLPIKRVPFLSSISVDEIIQMHLKNGIKNVNETMNAFMIYRNEFNHIHQNFNLSCKNVSKLTSKSWKNESEYVKDYYKQISKEVKKCFKEIVPTTCFINKFGTSNQVGTNNVSLETNPPMDKNSPDSIYSSHQFVNMGPMNQISPEITCHNSLLMNTEQNSLGTTCYNSPPSNPQDVIYSSYPGTTYVNSPPSNSLNAIYSSHKFGNMGQNSSDVTSVDQYPPEITLTDPSNIDKISPGICCYNLPFLNVLDISHVNSQPSNSLSTIYFSQNSPDATNSNPPMVQYPPEITFPDPNMEQMFPGINCYNSQLMNADQNSTDATYYNSARIDCYNSLLINVEKNFPDTTCYNPTFLSIDNNSLDATYFNSPSSYTYQDTTYFDDHF
ncbi:11591_t:CDS:2 [Diversispora eburnea]|uniref:11591_t:CDS:1 n=1 Tax=Diversispora eburnea TaxID=1213867 RepID=A0A9N9C9W4_9GLOM|nr:11591_t:CDS:2 [Diversispora eburnea]